jgi:hypothetical protein
MQHDHGSMWSYHESVPYPFRSQIAKVELYGILGSASQPRPYATVFLMYKQEVLSNVVDWPLWSRGYLLLVSFYQLPIPELGSRSYQRHQMMSV